MYPHALAFTAGVLTLPLFSTIPSLFWFLPVCITAALLWYLGPNGYKRIFSCLLIGLLGCWFVLGYSQHLLRWELPKSLETNTITITGQIVSLPKIEDDTARFEFALDSLNGKPQHARLQLAWYHYHPIDKSISVGERWQFQVRLKRPHGLLNPGGFDYEKWLFSRGIRATGYVTNPNASILLETSSWRFWVERVRAAIQENIQTHLKGETTVGLISALVMGAQNDITQSQWQVMRATGTNHLMAIAGVHIAFVSGFIYVLVQFLWRSKARLALLLPTPQAAAIGALLTALIYSALAGFSLPTQRALVMLLVFMSGLFLRRDLNPWNSFVLALCVIVLWEPLETLSISFWLSFAAVFAIIYGITGRIHAGGLWWKYGRIQWVITLMLIPLTLVLFQQSSLIALIANMIAVPAVGIFVLPLCLVGALLTFIFPWLGHWLLWLAAKNVGIVWWILGWLGNLQGATWMQHVPHFWALIAAVMGVLWMLAPRGFPARNVGVLGLFPLLFWQASVPAAGAVRLSVLDVGQGLASVVQTKNHILIFDTGPPMGKNDDAGGRVILPFLQAVGISRLDTLVLSHGDSDHIGGALTLLNQFSAEKFLTSTPERFPAFHTTVCQQGQQWEWDGVRFSVLYPTPQLLGQKNNSSCVLRIDTKNGSALLTGDIEQPAEEYLVSHAVSWLPANVLVAPHHGSGTSSTADFVHAVNPHYVVFPTGYKNRFHFPNGAVVARYKQSGAVLFDTAMDGAVMFEIGGQALNVKTQRALDRKVWRENK